MMRKKIESLSQRQQDQFAEYRDRWIKIGLSTEAADRPRAETAIKQMYASAGLELPRRIVWCGSPLSQGLTRAIILDKSVGASVGDSVWDSVRDSVRDSVGDSGYGQHDANWLAFFQFFREECGLTAQTDKLVGHFEQAQSAGWYLPHQHICWVSERHHILACDERGRLHCETGPAVMYPDGWAIYAWHGVRVPMNVIEQREKTTVKDILQEQNTEVRRVMRNLYGNDRFMIDAGAKEVDHTPSHGAALLALHLPGDPVEIRMMRLTCPSTGSVYFERVPPDVRTAMEGLSWRFNVKPAEYQPIWES